MLMTDLLTSVFFEILNSNSSYINSRLKQLGYSPIIPISTGDVSKPDIRKSWIENQNMQVLSLQSFLHPENNTG